MEDLRKSYNVTKKSKSFFKMPNLLNIKLKVFRNLFILIIIGLLLFNPSGVSSTISNWLNTIYTSFMGNLDITSMDWYNILITILAFIIFYKLIQWRHTK